MKVTIAKGVVLLMSLAKALASCSIYSGPSGAVDCITIPRYNYEKQWGTCLTDAYIQSKSKGHHKCEDRTATYCYYQCMLEVYDENTGSVNPTCSCDNQESSSTTACPPSEVELPGRCFSPDGTDCDWYRDCLEARFQCSGSDDDYGIAYAEKYCRLYDANYQDFSALGKQWINAVRKCLQVELVPLLRPFECPTCQDIKTRAFDSHAGCYVTPYRDAPSICSLPILDFWRIFWTIKSAFTSEFVETVYGMWQVGKRCTALAADGIADFMSKLMIEVALPEVLAFKEFLRNKRSLAEENDQPLLAYLRQGAEKSAEAAGYSALVGNVAGPSSRRKRSTGNDTWRGESSEELHYHQTAAEVAKELADQLGWGSMGIQWFAYGVYNESDGRLRVNVFLAEESYNATSPSNVNLTRVVQQAAEAYQGGKIRFKVGGTPLPAGQLIGCRDEECQQVFANATGASVSNAAVCPESTWLMMALSMAAATILLKTLSLRG